MIPDVILARLRAIRDLDQTLAASPAVTLGRVWTLIDELAAEIAAEGRRSVVDDRVVPLAAEMEAEGRRRAALRPGRPERG